MNKLLVALIAGAFASVAAAQTAAPKATTMEKQDAVKAATGQPVGKDAAKAVSPENPTGAAGTAIMQKETTAKSKETAKTTGAEKKMIVKDSAKSPVNPDNPTGAAGTAAMQKETTAASKAVPKQNVQLKSKEGQKQLEKDLQEKAKK